MDHPRAGLRYVDADDLDNSTLEFDGLRVESRQGELLGDVDGFVIDIDSARPYYIVVNAGGWFTSKYFLLPIGHAALDRTSRKLVTELTQDHVKKFPGFDRDEFERITDADLSRMDRQMLAVCCPDEPAADAGFRERYRTWKHYQEAAWWDASFYRPDRADRAAWGMTSIASTPPTTRSSDSAGRVAGRIDDRGDVSPHFEGRAQPGDVIGIETGGEETHVGDTSEDENQRRRDAQERAAGRER